MLAQYTLYTLNSLLYLLFIIRTARVSKQVLKYEYRNVRTTFYAANYILSDNISLELVKEF